MMSDNEPTTKEIHDSRRWTGDPAMAAEPLKFGVLRSEDIAWQLRALMLVGWIFGVAGLGGLGYYENEMIRSSAMFQNSVYTIPEDYKGHIRFVSQFDGQVCSVSAKSAVGGIVAFGLLMSVASVLQIRRR
jgi:hypothetical protein